MNKNFNNRQDDEDDNKYSETEIVGYCNYCHSPIFGNEKSVKRKGKIYHEFCHLQKNR